MARITELELKQEFKNGYFGHFYFLYGEEKMLINMYEQKLCTKLMGKEPPEFNYHRFNENSDIKDIINAMNIVPFTAPYNYVCIEDFPVETISESDNKIFLQSLEDIPDGTVVIIAMRTKVPNSKKYNSWKKLIDVAIKYGTVVEFNKKTIAELRRQIVSWVSKRGLAISMENAGKIIEYSGTDLNTLRNETNKLCAFVDGDQILSEHIEKIVTKNLSSRVYDMTEAMVYGDWNNAFKSLNQLFYQQEEPIKILAEISATYVDMYRVRIAVESGLHYEDVANDFDYKRREFRLKKADRASKKMSTESICLCIEKIAEINMKMNSTSTNKRLLLEKLIASLIMESKGKIV